MSEVTITVRVTMIRDGTHGISMCAPDKILGEWQDSGAVSLAVMEDKAISICGKDGKHRYMLTLPGTPVKGELVSETEALVVVQI
jgi:hypothetical protein